MKNRGIILNIEEPLNTITQVLDEHERSTAAENLNAMGQ